jgi:hypothetical protein
MCEDKSDRWKPNRIIHMFYNVRQKGMRLIAPVVPCTSIQRIKIKWHYNKDNTVVRVIIEDSHFGCVVWNKGHKKYPIITDELHNLAFNDGFDSVEDFFKWFNKDFTGKIIHWTNFKY